MKYFPIFLDLRDQTVLIVGGGVTAARRCTAIIEAGGRARVVAEALSEAFEDCRDFEHLARAFRPGDLDGAWLVFVATDDDALNCRVAALARKRGIPVNVADRRRLCSFIMPSIVNRSPVVVAVSSGGEAPILSRLLRAQLEARIPRRLGRLAAFAGDWRQHIKQAIPDAARRRRFWERVTDGPVGDYILAGRTDDARRLLEEILSAERGGGAARSRNAPNEVIAPDYVFIRGASGRLHMPTGVVNQAD